MSQNFRKTILIVCEGQRSEPDYFNNLRNEVLSKINDIFIKILPIPKDEQIAIEKEAQEFVLRKGAKKREIKKALNNLEPDDYIIENEYRAQPTCYVRKAQLAYFEKGYSELWAVYDNDGHPDHEKAYNLSIDSDICEKIVNIGFSSISFEEWILMHFEFCDIKFLKSQCRDKNKEVFDCGTGTKENDCKGTKCVVGRIVTKQFLYYNDSKNFEYKDYNAGIDIALYNALISRDFSEDKKKFYNNNPYVSLDRLVYKLKNIEFGDLIWSDNCYFEIDSNVFIKIITKENITKIFIDNKSNATFIFLEESLKLIKIDRSTVYFNDRKTISPKECVELFTKENLTIDDFHYALFKINDIEYKILDVVQIKNSYES